MFSKLIKFSIFVVLLAVFLNGLKKYRLGVCMSTDRMDGRTVIITGANTGVGFETAVDLASRGARVILACRSSTRGEEAAARVRKLTKTGADRVVFMKLDLSSLKSVREFAKNVLQQEDKIHVLLNNAGVFGLPLSHTEDGFEMHLGVNHLGHFLLTKLLLERLKKSAPSRIINVSSEGHYKSGGFNFSDLHWKHSPENYGFLEAYSKSKLANVMFTVDLSRRLSGTGVVTNSLNPGMVATDIARGLPAWFNFILTRLGPYLFVKTSREGAHTQICLCADKMLERVSGLYFNDCAAVEADELVRDEELRNKLWSVSEELVGEKY